MNIHDVDFESDASGNTNFFTYDSAGRVSCIENALGLKKYFEYTDTDKRCREWGDVPNPVECTYNAYGMMTNMATYRSGTNWSNAAWPGGTETPDNTAWVFDEASGLVTSKRYADGSSESFTYSVNGKTLTHTLARSSGGSHEVTFSYDSATGDKLGIDYSDSTPDVTFTYNRLGRKVTVSDAVGGRGFAYNSAFQLESETITNTLAGTTNVLSYGYATNGLAGRHLGFDLDSDYAISYAHDTYGRMNSVTHSNFASFAPFVVNYSYLSNSDLITVMTNSTYGFSSIKTYENNRDLITSVENTFGTNLVSKYEYGNDVLARRTNRIDSGSAVSGGSTNVFGYNSRSELTSALMGTNGSAYSYDPIGNRISSTNNSDGVTLYSANDVNQYTSVTNDSGASDLFYDLDGNTTNDGTHAYTWNCGNRLIEVEPLSPDTNSYKVAFTYDFMGRRCSKEAYGFDGTNWNTSADESRCFVYDGYNLISESIVTSGSTNDRVYVFGLDLSGSLQGAGGIGGLLAAIQDDAVYFPSFDANGNVCQYADTNGTIVASREYSAYGETISSSGAMADDLAFWFSTKALDTEIDIYCFGFRYYNCETGRWVSRDHIGEEGGLNIYAYLDNAPVDLLDLLGFGMLDLTSGTIASQVKSNQKLQLLVSIHGLPVLNTSIFWERVKTCLTGTLNDFAERGFPFSGSEVLLEDLWEGIGIDRKALDAQWGKDISDYMNRPSHLRKTTQISRNIELTERQLAKKGRTDDLLARLARQRERLRGWLEELDRGAQDFAKANRIVRAKEASRRIKGILLPPGSRGYFHTHPPYSNVVPSANDFGLLGGVREATGSAGVGFVAAPEDESSKCAPLIVFGEGGSRGAAAGVTVKFR